MLATMQSDMPSTKIRRLPRLGKSPVSASLSKAWVSSRNKRSVQKSHIIGACPVSRRKPCLVSLTPGTGAPWLLLFLHIPNLCHHTFSLFILSACYLRP